MDRLKTFGIYAIIVILFIIISEFVINVGLNSQYKEIERRDGLSQVEIYQAEATLRDGRIRGIIKNSQPEELSGKYLKINYYSKRDVFLGNQYIEINKLETNGVQAFETFFNIENVNYYKVELVEQKETAQGLELFSWENIKQKFILATVVKLIIL